MSISKSALDNRGGARDTLNGKKEESDLGRYIFRKYCGSNQYITKDSLKFVLRDIYGFSHQHFEEVDKNQAIDDMYRILDLDKDGKVTIQDIETLVTATFKDNSGVSISTKTMAIREEDTSKIVDDMLNSMAQLGPNNIDIGMSVFAAYDSDHTDFIDKQDLPLVISDIFSQMGLPSKIDRPLMMSRLADFELRSKGRISKKEFEYFYKLKFGF